LANPHDPKDIAEKIKFLFDNPEKGIEMGTAARARVLKEFDIEVIVERNIDFFSKHLRK
jgi:glycosyltransferase involved in cell wall biosynthesis